MRGNIDNRKNRGRNAHVEVLPFVHATDERNDSQQLKGPENSGGFHQSFICELEKADDPVERNRSEEVDRKPRFQVSLGKKLPIQSDFICDDNAYSGHRELKKRPGHR